MSQQRIGWWGLNLTAVGIVALFAPLLIVTLAFALPWVTAVPGRIESVGSYSLYVCWTLAPAFLIAALCLGHRSRGAWMGMLSLILSATALLGIGAFVGWIFWGL